MQVNLSHFSLTLSHKQSRSHIDKYKCAQAHKRTMSGTIALTRHRAKGCVRTVISSYCLARSPYAWPTHWCLCVCVCVCVCVSVCVCMAEIRMYPLARNHARFNVMGKHYQLRWAKVTATYWWHYGLITCAARCLFLISSYTGKIKTSLKKQELQFSLWILLLQRHLQQMWGDSNNCLASKFTYSQKVTIAYMLFSGNALFCIHTLLTLLTTAQ